MHVSPDTEVYSEKLIFRDMFHDIPRGMTGGVKATLPVLVQTAMDYTLENIITEILMEDYHRNKVRESVKD